MTSHRGSITSILIGLVAVAGVLAQQQQPPPAQQTEVSTVITSGPGAPQPRLGLPDFSLGTADPELKAAAETVANVLWNDLEFEEEFYMIPRARSTSIPVTDSIETLPIDAWAELGADYVVMGRALQDGARLMVEIRVVGTRDASARKLVHGYQYNCDFKAPRTCAHYISDDMHLKLARVNGIAQSQLAFVSDRDEGRQEGPFSRVVKEIYISDYDGANQQRVTGNRTLSLSPTFSPDGQLLAYVSYTSGFPDLYLRPLFQVGRLTRPAAGNKDNQNQGPVFSPDGSLIAFSSNRDGNSEIYIVDRDGKGPARRLTNNALSDTTPSWSPTGAEIAFISDRSGTNVLYKMTADGLGVDQLTSVRADRPSWSPLGNIVAFTCGSTKPFNICTVDVATKKVVMLTDGPNSNEQPVFAPNGRHIAYTMIPARSGGKSQIGMIDIKGKVQKVVTETGNNNFPAWSRNKR
jgi:TolB protein